MFLLHFDLSKCLVLACDVWLYGIGMVLSHCSENGTGKPIAFSSQSLGPYSQLEKKGLAIFGEKYHQYLFSKKFQALQHLYSFNTNSVVVTDHENL